MRPAAVLRSRSGRRSAKPISGTRAAPYLGFLKFCDPTLVEHAPSGREWVHEIKTDGYRAQVHVRGDKVVAYSRSGYDWTEQFAPIAAAARRLKVREAILDGEATVLGNTGLPDFQALRRELGNAHSQRLLYHAFDLLYLDGVDLRSAPLLERKQMLREILTTSRKVLVYVEHLEADGPTVFEHACRMGLEGIVSKRRDSPYRAGRSESWLKLKCVRSDTFPIVAFVEKLGASPRKIASLYLGRWQDDQLLYAGKARSGYTDAAARELREALDPLIRRSSPLAIPVKKPKATWVEPSALAEIEHAGFTDDGLLRAAVFKGLREDLAPRRGSGAEPPMQTKLNGRAALSGPIHRARNGRSAGGSIHGVPRANILQLLPEAVSPSKEELIAYWRKAGKRALKYLGRRPLKLVRHTHGITFYHKGPLPEIPEAVHQLRIDKREGGEGVRVWVDDLDGLLGLVAMGVVEVHPWAAGVDDIEHPDRLVFDLDPGEGVQWDLVVESALALRELLKADAGLDSWPKLTGGKGVHLMVPITPRMTHDEARVYSRALAQRLSAAAPSRYTLSADPAKRARRIFIDYLRNGRGTTAVGTYSPRARPGFPIAAPVRWTDIARGTPPDAYSINHLPARR
ncbi:MAG: DNA ligase D [Xanthobacteraceae bacterium]